MSPAFLAVLPLLMLLFAVPTYHLVFMPFSKKLTGHPIWLHSSLQRMGLYLIISYGSNHLNWFHWNNRVSRNKTTKLSIFILFSIFSFPSCHNLGFDQLRMGHINRFSPVNDFFNKFKIKWGLIWPTPNHSLCTRIPYIFYKFTC